MKPSLGLAVVVLSMGTPVLARAQNDANGQSQMQAGGLTPPPPQEETESAKTEENLEQADKEDSGRGLEWVHLDVEGGVEHLGLETIHSNNLVPSTVETTATGPVFGAGLGFRLIFITVGARFRYAHFSQYDLWTLGAELGLRIPLGSLEPYFVLGGGYAALGSFTASDFGQDTSQVAIHGFNVRGGGGLDYYVTPVFSIGANLTAELLALARPGFSSAAAGTTVSIPDGSSVGMGVALTGVLGLHF
jgi:hypothetical protein